MRVRCKKSLAKLKFACTKNLFKYRFANSIHNVLEELNGHGERGWGGGGLRRKILGNVYPN